MGPQLDSCGRLRHLRALPTHPPASMGPQLDSCGRSASQMSIHSRHLLQWGRNLTVAEGSRQKISPPQPRGASMGPQLDSCGRGGAGGGRRPCSLSLQWGRNLTVAEGRPPYVSTWGACQLQWGRNLTVAEGYDTCAHCQLTRRLQWGRNLTVAEGSVLGGALLVGVIASMGPQLDSCGRRPRSSRGSPRPQTLQWGRNLTVAEGSNGCCRSCRV